MARVVATAARPAATGIPATTSPASVRAAMRAGSATGEQPVPALAQTHGSLVLAPTQALHGGFCRPAAFDLHFRS